MRIEEFLDLMGFRIAVVVRAGLAWIVCGLLGEGLAGWGGWGEWGWGMEIISLIFWVFNGIWDIGIWESGKVGMMDLNWKMIFADWT